MDEYEKLEGDLEKLYAVYITKYRSLSFLEHQLEDQNRQEQDQLEVWAHHDTPAERIDPFHRKQKTRFVECSKDYGRFIYYGTQGLVII